MPDSLEFTLNHDTTKVLKDGKRRYGDGNGHMIYLSANEVQQLEESDIITMTLAPKSENQ